MKDLHIYEIVSITGEEDLQFALLTENGLGDGESKGRIAGENVEIEGASAAVRLLGVAETVRDHLSKGAAFHVINLNDDSVQKVNLEV